MEILGYVAALSIGVLLGLIGGGGSILTVPVLVYLFGVSPVLATAYSLFIVGVTSAVGSVNFFKKGLVDVRTAIIFGTPSIVAVYLTRKFILPALPVEIIFFEGFMTSKDTFLMLLFAVLMLLAAYFMIKPSNQKPKKELENTKYNYPLIMLEGLLIGVLTGMVGAGGGFLLIPALVILSNLPIRRAIGTSLVIIGAKSLIGFLGEIGQTELDWVLLGSISLLAIGGIFLGAYLSKWVKTEVLKPVFGYFVLAMGLFIVLSELVF